MKEHYVSYEQSVALKRLGFDWEVRGYYTHDDNFQKVREVTALNHNDTKKFKGLLSAPRLDQAAAWLRDKGIHISANPYMGYDVDADGALYNEYPLWSFELMKVANADFFDDAGGNHESYESALSAGLDAALELLGKEVKE